MSARQKFTDLQTDYAELVAFLRKKGIKSTVFIWDTDPNDVRVRAVGTYRRKKWMQEVGIHKFLALTPGGMQAVLDELNQKAEEEWGKKHT